MLYSLWFTLCVLFTASSVATAKECRQTKSVIESASLVENVKAGGHVWIHVLGLKHPLAKKPHQEVGKTMFASEKDYFLAWRSFFDPKFQTKAKLSNCGGSSGGQMDCIPAADLGITRAFVCTKLDDKTGLCSAAQAVTSKELMIGFWYASSKGKWILNTAYPSTHPQCY